MSKKPKPRSERTEWTPPTTPVATVAAAVAPPEKLKREKVFDLVEEIPARCSKCGSTERTPKGGVITRNLKGKKRDGTLYDRVIWARCKCMKCGRMYRTIRYEFSGE